MIGAAVRVALSELAMPIEGSDLARVDAILESLPDTLSPCEFAAAEARGAAMTATEVIHTAMASIDRVLGAAS